MTNSRSRLVQLQQGLFWFLKTLQHRDFRGLMCSRLCKARRARSQKVSHQPGGAKDFSSTSSGTINSLRSSHESKTLLHPLEPVDAPPIFADFNALRRALGLSVDIRHPTSDDFHPQPRRHSKCCGCLQPMRNTKLRT